MDVTLISWLMIATLYLSLSVLTILWLQERKEARQSKNRPYDWAKDDYELH